MYEEGLSYLNKRLTSPLLQGGHSYINILTKLSSPSRQNPFYLLVALDNTSMASGQLFLDDGESLGDIPTASMYCVIV